MPRYLRSESFPEVIPDKHQATVYIPLRRDVHILRPIDSASRRSGGIVF